MPRVVAQKFVMFFGWAEEEVQRRVNGTVQEVILFRFDIFLQHPPEVLFMVAPS